VDEKSGTVKGLGIPGGLSYLVHFDRDQPVPGLRSFAERDRPPVRLVFQSYHLMVAVGMALIGLALLAALLWLWRGQLFETRWLLWCLVPSVLLPQIANQLGWVSAEVGRQPWIVHGLLRTQDAASRGDLLPGARIHRDVHGDLPPAPGGLPVPDDLEDPARPGRAGPSGGTGRGGRRARMTISLDLASLWFVLIGVLLVGYAILDGYDLGVGALHLVTRGDQERRTLLNAIGPVWDGNEVWLLTAGGALFAAFPPVCATLFSGFYTAFMLFLAAAIGRAVSLECRSQATMPWWPRLWDGVFGVSSIAAALLLGVALGNVARGLPITADREFGGTFLGLLDPYTLVVGLTTVALFVAHGGVYLQLKTDGALLTRVERWTRWAFVAVAGLHGLLTVLSLATQPHLVAPLRRSPVLVLVPLLGVLALLVAIGALARRRPGRALLASSGLITSLLATLGLGLYPHLVYARNHPALSLTVHDAASSPRTLLTMLIIARIGLPLVLGYPIFVHWLFRGKVRLDDHSY
jgi:cytochrome bd ubiquinol oxidase subunit II